MSRIVSEDALRRAFATIEEEAGAAWLRRDLDHCLEPLLAEAWILDVVSTSKRLGLGGDWAARRMKAMRFALPGLVVRHARRLIVRLSAGALDLIRDARAAILSLQPAPSG